MAEIEDDVSVDSTNNAPAEAVSTITTAEKGGSDADHSTEPSISKGIKNPWETVQRQDEKAVATSVFVPPIASPQRVVASPSSPVASPRSIPGTPPRSPSSSVHSSESGGVYIRSDGKAVRRVRRRNKGESSGEEEEESSNASPGSSSGEVYVRSDGKKVRRVKRSEKKSVSPRSPQRPIVDNQDAASLLGTLLADDVIRTQPADVESNFIPGLDSDDEATQEGESVPKPVYTMSDTNDNETQTSEYPTSRLGESVDDSLDYSSYSASAKSSDRNLVGLQAGTVPEKATVMSPVESEIAAAICASPFEQEAVPQPSSPVQQQEQYTVVQVISSASHDQDAVAAMTSSLGVAFAPPREQTSAKVLIDDDALKQKKPAVDGDHEEFLNKPAFKMVGDDHQDYFNKSAFQPPVAHQDQFETNLLSFERKNTMDDTSALTNTSALTSEEDTGRLGQEESAARRQRRFPIPEMLMARTQSHADVDTPLAIQTSSSGEPPHMIRLNEDEEAMQFNTEVAQRRVKVVQLLTFGSIGLVFGLFGSFYVSSTCHFATATVSVAENQEPFQLRYGLWKYTPIDSAFQGYSYCYKYDGYGDSPLVARTAGILGMLLGIYSVSILWFYLIFGRASRLYWTWAVRLAFTTGVLNFLTLSFFVGSVCRRNSCALGPGAAVALGSTIAWCLLGYEMHYNRPTSKTIPEIRPCSTGESNLVGNLEMSDFSNGASDFISRISDKNNHRGTLPSLNRIQRSNDQRLGEMMDTFSGSRSNTWTGSRTGSYRPPSVSTGVLS